MCAGLTVRAGLKLEAGAAGSISSSSASSDLQQVCSVGLQTVQSHVTTPGTENGVAGLLLLLRDIEQRTKTKTYLQEWTIIQYGLDLLISY